MIKITVSKLLLIITFLNWSTISYAQIEISPKIGMTSSKIHQLSVDSYFLTHSDKFGQGNITFGLSTRLKLKEKWYLQADFFYSIRETLTNDNLQSTAPYYKLESKSIDSNVQISYQPFQYIYFELGPYNSYTFAVTGFGKGGFSGEYYKSDFLEPGIFKRYDFGMTGGISVQHWNIVLGLKYFYGLKNISFKQKNRMLQLTMGYYFTL